MKIAKQIQMCRDGFGGRASAGDPLFMGIDQCEEGQSLASAKAPPGNAYGNARGWPVASVEKRAIRSARGGGSKPRMLNQAAVGSSRLIDSAITPASTEANPRSELIQPPSNSQPARLAAMAKASSGSRDAAKRAIPVRSTGGSSR